MVYVVVMAIVFVLFLRDTVTVGSVLGLLASLPMFRACVDSFLGAEQ